MEVLTQTELRLRLEEIVEKVKKGALFIHPTDTIYGIGCNAVNEDAVRKLRVLKDRLNMPLSVWVPSLNWIRENCVLNEKTKKWLDLLPGPYTLIFPLKNEKAVAKNVAPNMKTIGVRYPDHWFGKVVEMCGVPVITTSANKAGHNFMTKLEHLDQEIEKGVEFMVYEGEKKAKPSKIVDVEKEEVKER